MCAIVALPAAIAAQAAPSADLQITKSDGAVLVVAGRNVTYTMDVKNLGPNDAENVVVTDRVPENARYAGGGCANDAGIVTCSLGKIAAGKSARTTFSVTVNSSATGTLVSTAIVNSSTQDSNQANNSGTDSDTSIIAECDLGLTASANPLTAAANQKVTFTIAVTNGGPSDGANLPVVLTLPKGLTFDNATEGGELKNGKVEWSIESLKANGRAQRQVTAIVNDGVGTGDHTADVTAMFDGDPNTANNSASVALTVQ
ncbi:MAG: DUF11 domain-containing protein [Candidatus Sumerlaeota bacterium]